MSRQNPPAEIAILSAGAPKAGVANCTDAFADANECQINITFATAPVLRQKVGGGEARADIVVAPAAVMKDFLDAGLVADSPVTVIGAIKAAVAVRAGAALPDISSAEALRREILAARSLVYNRASSGAYIESMMERLGIADEVAAKTARVATGAAAMEHLADSDGDGMIGFGQQTEIRLHEAKGIKLVGPLPAELENITTYQAGVLTAASLPGPAGDLVAFMASPAAAEIFRATGLE